MRVIGLKENKEDAKTGRKKSTIKNSANKKRWYKEEEKKRKEMPRKRKKLDIEMN